ncbi:MAG: hypothetical protein ABIX28_05175 [Vicinamibacterales bacterium]
MPTGSSSSARRLRVVFDLAVAGIAIFELAKVYFIMPMPGSQRIKSLDAAYALHTWRWAFRFVALVAIASAFGPRSPCARGGVRFRRSPCSPPSASLSPPTSC